MNHYKEESSGLAEWLKQWSACLASVKPCIQTPELTPPPQQKIMKPVEIVWGGDK
jgi:hypothetical protein